MNNAIRILHVLGRLDRGGAETMVMNLYRNIDRSKVQFDFVKHTEDECDYDDEILKLGGKIHTISRYNGKNHYKYMHQWRTLFEAHPEYKIIHGHMRSTASIYLKIAKNYGVTTIAHSHSTASRGNKLEQIIKYLLQLPVRYEADYLFACSDEAGRWLFGKKSVKKSNYRLFKNAIDINKYLFNQATRNKIRKILGIEDKFVIGHVGSFTYPKNHKFLVEVFNEVKRRKNNSTLLLLGDGELRENIITQIERLGIEDNVILLGNVPNINEYLQAMDVFAFPSIFEGLGISVIEAQTAGLPCVVSDNVPEVAFITKVVSRVQMDVHLWENKILDYCNYERTKIPAIVFRNAGYDIEKSSQELIGFYIEKSLFYNTGE
ncbi:glycosyltransferase family 1 protein [Brassicibacter mesophilus]|uniref:glycosyltransferase family 1 protein n=1 Tax=Brassicibacter mesophilus TaxID=745119 RepID=UPI003D2349A4